MKQLKFGHFNKDRKTFFQTVNFLQKEEKTAPKRPILFCLVYQGVFGHFRTIYFRFPKVTEDFRRLRRFSKANEEVRPLPKISEEPSKHLTVLSSEQQTLNTWPIEQQTLKIMGE